MPEVTLGVAAERLGVSRSTVRRRIERGVLSGRKEITDAGDVWLVTLPDEEEKPMVNRDVEDDPNGDQQELPPEATADYADGAPGVLMAEEEMTCAICHLPIEEADDYIRAAYGPVHPEPCSHQSKQG